MSFVQDSAQRLAETCVAVRREKRANWLMDQVQGLPGRAMGLAKQLPGAIRQLPPELVGAGVGAGIGAALPPHGADAESKRRNRLNRLLLGALAGGAAGTAYRYGTQGIPRTETMPLPEAANELAAQRQAETSGSTETNLPPSVVDVRSQVKWPLRTVLSPGQAYAGGAAGAITHEAYAAYKNRLTPTSPIGLQAIRAGIGSAAAGPGESLKKVESLQKLLKRLQDLKYPKGLKALQAKMDYAATARDPAGVLAAQLKRLDPRKLWDPTLLRGPGLQSIRDSLDNTALELGNASRLGPTARLSEPDLANAVRAAMAGQHISTIGPQPSLLSRVRAMLPGGKRLPTARTIAHGLEKEQVLTWLTENAEAARKLPRRNPTRLDRLGLNSTGWKGTLGRGAAWMALPLAYDQYVKFKDEQAQQAVLRGTLDHVLGK